MAEPSLASVMTMMAKVLEKVEKRDTERETRASTERQERQAEKIIDKIPAMTEGSDLELYLQGLELLWHMYLHTYIINIPPLRVEYR